MTATPFFLLWLLQFKKFSSKIFITQSTELNFWAKFYQQHKHIVYYWRLGKHTISSSTQQFVHFSGTFKPWLLMLIFVKSLWKWIWLWTLKYGRGTHHKKYSTKNSMPRFPAELFTYLADPIDHVAEEKAAAANEELQPSRLRAHVDAQQPHMILLRLTHIYWTPPKPMPGLFFLAFPCSKIDYKNLTKISTESRP